MEKYGNYIILWNRVYVLGKMKTKTDKETIEYITLMKKLIPEGEKGFKIIDESNDTEN